MNNEPDLEELIRDVRRRVATARFDAFEEQAHRLGDFVSVKFLSPTKASEILYDVALSNGLVREHGEEIIQGIMAHGLTGGS